MNALFIGLTTFDIQYFVENFPAANTKIKTNSPLMAAGGPAANAAIMSAALGGNVDFLTCIGKHHFSSFVLEDLQKFNVKVIDPYKDISIDPIVATILTNICNSERTILTHHPEKLSKHPSYKVLNIKDYDIVFTDGFYPELSLPLLRKAREEGVPVVLDGGSWKAHLPQILENVDIAICSANFHPPACNTNNTIIKFLKEYGIKHVAISQGQHELVADFGYLPVPQVKAVDSLGAGDILHGAFCWYFAQSHSFEDALSKAIVLASHSVKFKGVHNWINTENLLAAFEN